MSALRCLLAIACAGALSACSVLPRPAPPPVVFDFGLAPALAAPPGAPAAVQTTSPPWLDSTAMLYRLAYSDSARLRSYRDSRWAAPPAAMLNERMRQGLARTTGPAASLTLRVELEEFSQVFDAPDSSHVIVRLRAALVEASTGLVLRQQAFSEETPAATADAPGGARALAQVCDAVLTRVMAWAVAAG